MKHFLRFWPLVILLALGINPVRGAGVVGNGTPGSCTESALAAAMNGGGLVTFNCGGPHAITLTGEKMITADTIIDGAGVITLSGGSSTRIFNIQNGAAVTLRNLTIANGYSSEDGGGIFAERLSTLTIENSTFSGNVGYNGGAIATNGWGANDAGVVVSISGSSFSNNTATAPAIPNGGNGGGGIYLSGGSAGTVTASSFSGNQSQNGGAIHLLHANLHTVNVTFSNNIANNTAGGGGGGAIYMDGTKGLTGELRIEQSSFTGNNTNQLGGAIFSFPEGTDHTIIDQSTFAGNVSSNGAQGGAIYHQSATRNGPLTVSNSTFVDNVAIANQADNAGSGGALWLLDAVVTISNSTFTGNEAIHSLSLPGDDWHLGFGGAIRTSENTTIINSTLVGNHAGFVGGAIAGPATVRNTIIANNTGGNVWQIQQNCTDELTNGGHNIQFPQRVTGNWNDYECFAGQTAVNPLTGNLGDYGGPTETIPLLDGSPAINAATNCPATDQRGFARNGACDIGAFEYGGGMIITSLNPSMSGLDDVHDFTLTVNGAGFGANSVVRWQGAERVTTVVSSFVVTAVIPASDVDQAGTFNVTIYDPDRSLESAPATFTVVPVLYQVYLPAIQR